MLPIKINSKFKAFVSFATIFAISFSSGCRPANNEANKQDSFASETAEIVETFNMETEESINSNTSILTDSPLELYERPPLEKSLTTEIDFTKFKPNEAGDILILMYHGLLPKGPHASYQRTIADFKDDIQKLYDSGFRLSTLADVVNNNIKTPAGYSPVVLTFDDAMSTAFSLVEKDGKLVPTTDCAVDILQKFAKKNPDFGNTALFGVNGGPDQFRGAGTISERYNYLINNGYEIGNHTYNHKQLSALTVSQLQEQIGKVEQEILDNVPNYKGICLVYPFGVRPKKGDREYAIKGKYKNTIYDYKVALREGQSGASANPGHILFDPLNIPRVRGSNNERTDLGWCFKYYEENPEKLFISDGNPDTVTVPKDMEKKLKMEALKDKEVIVYELEK